MFQNYLKIAFRNLLRHKVFSSINILGLAIGMAACLLIFLFVDHELSFDSFHPNKEQVYRLCEVQTWEGIIPQNVALSMYPMGPTLQEDYPEIEAFTRMVNRQEVPLEHGDQKIYVDKLFLTDTAFFEIFDFELLRGDKETALQEPNSILITEETALKFFEHTDVLGEQFSVSVGDTFLLKITGVLADIPRNSHLQFDGLISLNSFPEQNERWMQRWGNNWLVTYLKINPNADIAALEGQFPDYLKKHMGEDATDGYQLFLQSLSEVHLNSANITHDYQNFRKFDGKYIYTFSVLALLVLIIAAINFMNLSTARSAKRAREVGVRKAIGATKGHLSRQFVAESVIFSFLALTVALIITAACVPYLNELSNREISFFSLFKPQMLILILGVTVLLGIFSSLYPAWIMSGFNVVKAIKGKGILKERKFSLQNVLVVVQFAAAIIMIVGTIFATRQLYFMTEMDPGFNREQVLLLPVDNRVVEHFSPLKESLLQLPAVTGVTASGQRLGSNIHQTGIAYKADTATQNLAISHVNVDFDYINFYEIELLDGREFSKEYSQDSMHSFIINEQLAEKLGYEDPVGKPLKFGWQEEWGTIIALAKDFNYNSLHNDINPLAMSIQPWGFSEVSVRVNTDELTTVLPQIEKYWRESGTDLPFDYEFLDDHFAELYETDTQVSRVVGTIAILAIFIACMGLFGLISVSIEKRIKEIGIRKVLGASTGDLLIMLGKSTAVLVIIAIAFAVPVSWLVVNSWLSGFAYRIDIESWVFVLAGLMALAISLMTISYRSYKAANANPVESLRYE